MPFAGDQVPNAPSRVLHVAIPPWNQVDVAMEHGLPSHFSAIHADIETLHGWVFLFNLLLQSFQNKIGGIQFGSSKLEVVEHMPFGDHQRVTGRHWEFVGHCHTKFVLEDDPFWGQFAEYATG